MNHFKYFLLPLLFLLQMASLSAQEFLNIKELPERRTTDPLPPNRAEVVFVAGTNDLVITSTSQSVDKVSVPSKNPTSGQYEYIVTLDLSESNMRHFTVEKKGTGFVVRTKQKMIFQQGERHFIEVTEPEVKFTLNPMGEGTHLVQNEGCIEIVSPLPDLIVDAPKELGCDVVVTDNSAGSYVTSIKINTIKLEGIRNKYKNQPEALEEQTTIYVRFENGNAASVSVKELTQRKKLRYTVVPIGASATASANQVSNDFQYVVFKVTPRDALVRLDGELLTVNGGVASKYVSAGTYTYQVECTLYHGETGTVTVAGKKETIQIELKPAFGYINITGNSSTNGTVYIDKQKIGTAPLRSDKLPSGKHTVEIVKELYKPYSAEIVVRDGETTPMPVEMEANYAHVTFKAEEGNSIYINEQYEGIGQVVKEDGISIYINGQYEGKGQVVKDLTLGVYEVETKKEGCRTVKETYEITASMMNKTIPLESPIPILGSVKIESTPSDAIVLIDGEEKDKTPCVLSMMIGKHTLTLKADGYATMNREIVVEEGKFTEVNVALEQRSPITITSVPVNATIYINGKEMGLTPLDIQLPNGTYDVKAEYMGNSTSQKIEIKETQEEQVFTLNIGKFLDLTSTPTNAKLTIDGKKVGYTPNSSFLTFGTHKIKLKKDGVVKKTDITVTPTNQSKWDWDFSKSSYVNKDGVYYSRQEGKVKTHKGYHPNIFFTYNFAFSLLQPQWSTGLKIGAVETWGWNVSFMSNFNFKSYSASPMAVGNIYNFTVRETTRLGVSVGAVFRPRNVVLLFLNAGYGYRGVCYATEKEEDSNKNHITYYRYAPYTYHGAEVSAGLMLNFEQFIISAEVTTINFKYMEFNIGIGGLL